MGGSCSTAYSTHTNDFCDPTSLNEYNTNNPNEKTGCYVNEINPVQYYTQACSCSGVDCETWYPPTDSGYTIFPIGLDAKLGCYNKNEEYAGNSIYDLGPLCVYGNPTFTYNSYKPISYTKSPTVINGNYIPPQYNSTP